MNKTLLKPEEPGIDKVSSLQDFFELERSRNLQDFTRSPEDGGSSLWSYFRVYYAEALVLKKEAGIRVKQGMVRTLIKDIFYGNPFNIFSRPKYLGFVASDQRKDIDDTFVHPLDLLPQDVTEHMLLVELPLNRKNTYQQVASKRVFSAYILIILENLVSFFVPKRKLSHLKKFDEVEKILGTSINRNYQAKRFYGSYLLTKWMLKYWNRPETVFCCAPYPFMGRIVALKEAGVPIVEIQHGYVGNKHRAYNVPRNYGAKYYPDYFLSWGDYEKEYFGNPDNHYLVSQEKVFPVGNFYIDHLLNSYTKDQLAFVRESVPVGNVLVAVAMQDPLENDVMPFILQCALSDDSTSFLLLPRVKPHQYYRDRYDLPQNVFLLEGINTYQGILAADFHATIWSTTAIEASMLGKTNLMINPRGMSANVMGELLDEESNTFYANNPDEMVSLLFRLNNEPQARSNKKSRFHRSDVQDNIEDAVTRIFQVTSAGSGLR